MKILYDHQAFTTQVFGGVSKYFAEIIKELSVTEEIDLSVLMSNNHYLKQLELSKAVGFPTWGPRRFFPTVASQINKVGSLSKIQKGDFDVFHPTFFHHYFLESIAKPFVVTFHDCIAEERTDLPQMGGNWELKNKTLQKASHIIAVSEATKADILKYYEVPSDKISVIYHATRFDEYEKPNQPKGNYLLYVGTRDYYKNFDLFVKAIAPILIEQNLELFCVGGGSFSTAERQAFEELNISGRCSQKNVSDDESFFKIYSAAKCFVYPSQKEGFGIPILEAFAAGCPVVLNDIPVFKEIAANAASYFETNQPESLRQTVQQILQNRSSDLVHQGKERLKMFSWHKAAQETLNVYQKVV